MIRSAQKIKMERADLEGRGGLLVAPIIEVNGITLSYDRKIDDNVKNFLKSHGIVVNRVSYKGDLVVRVRVNGQLLYGDCQEFLNSIKSQAGVSTVTQALAELERVKHFIETQHEENECSAQALKGINKVIEFTKRHESEISDDKGVEEKISVPLADEISTVYGTVSMEDSAIGVLVNDDYYELNIGQKIASGIGISFSSGMEMYNEKVQYAGEIIEWKAKKLTSKGILTDVMVNSAQAIWLSTSVTKGDFLVQSDDTKIEDYHIQAQKTVTFSPCDSDVQKINLSLSEDKYLLENPYPEEVMVKSKEVITIFYGETAINQKLADKGCRNPVELRRRFKLF